MTSTSSSVHFKRQDCLRNIFRHARKGVCLYTRMELKNTRRIINILNDLTCFVRTNDNRFGKFFTKCIGKTSFEVYWEIGVGEENPSMYVHRGGVSVASVGLQAESRDLWKDEISEIEGLIDLKLNSKKIRKRFKNKSISIELDEQSEIELIIDRKFEEYTKKDQELLISTIQTLLDLDQPVIIKSIKKGSVKIKLQLKYEQCTA